MRGLSIVIAIMLVASACAGQGGTPSSAATPTVGPTEAIQTEASSSEAAPTVTAAPPSPTPLPAGVLAVIPTGEGPNELAATADTVWVEDHRLGHLSRIDPARNVEVDQLTDVLIHCDVAAGAGFVWATQASSNQATKVDPASGEVLGTISLRDACGVAADDKDLWVVSPGSGSVVRYDPQSNEERATVTVGANPFFVAIGPEAVWVDGEADGGTLWRIDPATNAVVASIPVPDTFATGVEVGHGSVWVPARDQSCVYRIDPASNTVAATIRMPSAVGGLAVGPDAIWTSGWGDGTVNRIDPATNEITGSISTGFGNLGPPMVAFDSVWVSAMDRNVVLRIDPAAVN
jgi:virginiamycin B lyase